jgi:single-strand DNA-binding protein
MPGGHTVRDVWEDAMSENAMTLVGNLVEDPKFSMSASGLARVRLRIAAPPRRFDREKAQWVDGDPLFLSVVAWRNLAQHCHDSLRKGDRVIVHGRLRQRTWETAQGENRFSQEIEAEAVGPDLLRSNVSILRFRRDFGAGQAPAAAPGVGESPEQPAAEADVWLTPMESQPGDPLNAPLLAAPEGPAESVDALLEPAGAAA